MNTKRFVPLFIVILLTLLAGSRAYAQGPYCEGNIGGVHYRIEPGHYNTIPNSDRSITVVQCFGDGTTQITVFLPAPPQPAAVPPTAPPKGTYGSGTMLVGRDSGRCLAVVGRYRVAHIDCNRYDGNQQWEIPSFVSTEIRLSQSQVCLTVDGGDVQAHYYVSSCRGQANQRWNIISYGSWIQLASQFSSKCVDERQWVPGSDAEIFQWHCKPISDDKELDNQLWIQSNVEDVGQIYPTPTPPQGVYVANIEVNETSPQGNKKCYTFRVTFSDIGGPQPFRWWVQLWKLGSGEGSGETPKLDQVLGYGVYDTQPWCVGFTTVPFSAQVYWWRDWPEPNRVPFRDQLGRKPSTTFQAYY